KADLVPAGGAETAMARHPARAGGTHRRKQPIDRSRSRPGKNLSDPSHCGLHRDMTIRKPAPSYRQAGSGWMPYDTVGVEGATMEKLIDRRVVIRRKLRALAMPDSGGDFLHAHAVAELEDRLALIDRNFPQAATLFDGSPA